MSSVSQYLSNFSYVPISRFDESTLIMGRMPGRPDEIVVDRWVLDNMIRKGGIIQNSITDVSYFLDRQIQYQRKNLSPTIVGISDGGEPAVYVYPEVFISLGSAGNEIVSLSSLKTMYPGKYDTVDLSGEVTFQNKTYPPAIFFINRTGDAYKNGGAFTTGAKLEYGNALSTEEPQLYAALAVADEYIQPHLNAMLAMTHDRIFLYCEDKEAVKTYLKEVQSEKTVRTLKVTVKDANADAWNAYLRASSMRLGGRQMVSLMVILLCMVMLYLLQRTRIRERIGMIAVYRLLGIPGGKLRAIFALESILLSLTSILPAALLTWMGIAVVTRLPNLEISMLLPWYAALGCYFALLGFHILAGLLPLQGLLKLPPARLAAKYDM